MKKQRKRLKHKAVIILEYDGDIGCGRVNTITCDNNRITGNNFDEGAISDAGTGTVAYLNFDPSAGAMIATINAPLVVGGGGGALP